MSANINLNTPVLSIHDLKSRSSDAIFLLKFMVYGASLLVGTYFALSTSALLQVLGTLILGLMFAHGVELQHQALHNQGLRERKSNDILGVILGLPMLVSFAGYQASHLRHHKYLGTAKNKEFFDYGDQYGGSRLSSSWLWFNRFMMPSHYLNFLKRVAVALWRGKVPDEAPDVSDRINRDYILMLLAIIVLGMVSYAMNPVLILKVWLIPLLVVATPAHALIEMPEHFRCDTSKPDVFQNTRTIQSNAFMNWYTNGNNYHVEHHLMPGLPIDRLHDLHIAIRKDIKNFHTSYAHFYLSLIRGVPSIPLVDKK